MRCTRIRLEGFLIKPELIEFVNTYFCDTFSTSPIQLSPTSLWAQFMYYIIFYYFKYDPSSCDLLGEIEEVWFGGYGSVPFEPFAWAQLMHATKWERDIGSTSGSWRRSCTWNFHLKTAFMLRWLWPNFWTFCMSPAYACYQVRKGHW